MLTINSKIDSAAQVDGELLLSFEQREKSRLRARLVSGEEVALFTVRGSVLRDGDLLRGDDGRVIRIIAASEPTYRVECSNWRALLRCAFHLGNRHTQTEVGGAPEAAFLRIRQDPVLKDMLLGLGASVIEQSAPFQPESGAYGGAHAHSDHLLAPIPLRQKIHRPSDRQP